MIIKNIVRNRKINLNCKVQIHIWFLVYISFFFFQSSILYSANKAGFRVIESNEKYLTLEFSAPKANIKSIKGEDGSNYLLPIIPGTYSDNQESGNPTKLMATANIAVPAPDKFKVVDIQIIESSKHSGTIAPVPTLYEFDGVAVEKLIRNNIYVNKPNYNLVDVTYSGIAANRFIAKVNVTAASWDFAKNEIITPTKIRIKIAFESNISNSSQFTSKIENYFSSSILNFAQTPNFAIPRMNNSSKISKALSENKIQQNQNNYVKIEISEEGIYKIDAGQLTSLGANIPLAEVNTIQLFGNGGLMLSENVNDAPSNFMKEQPILVKTKNDGSLESIIFFGAPTSGFNLVNKKIRRYRNVYSNNNFYMLTWGNTTGKRANAEELAGEFKKAPDTYYHRTFFEEEINNPYIKACGRSWFGRSIFSSPFVDMLHNLDRTKPIFMRFSLAHRSSTDGLFNIFENNQEIGKLGLRNVLLNSYQHSYRDFLELQVPSSVIPSDNRSILKLNYTNEETPTASTGYLDYYEIHYPRSYYAIDNELEFIADTTLKGNNEFSINGFSGELFGFDVSDLANPRLLFNSSKTNGLFIFKANLDTFGLNRFYISGKLKSPKLTKIINSNILEDDGSDVILLTDQSLLNSAKKFKEYRESQSNLKVKVVSINSIYNELNAGTPDITAIRDYVAYAFKNWSKSVKHLILWGDGHFDYRGVQFKEINPVPAYESADEFIYYFDETNQSYSTDDFFACVAGNDEIPDLSFGRITINSDAEGMNAVKKISHYEQNSSDEDWRFRVLFTADDGVGEHYDGSDHVDYSEELFKYHCPEDIISDRLYLVEYPAENVPGGKRKPLASEAMVSTFNTTSAILWNWIGHGNPRVLAHEWWFNRDVHVAQFNNYNKLPFFTAATCDFGRFDDPDTKSGAEELFLSTSGGVIGVLSATRVVYGSQNASLNNALYDIIFENIKNGENLTIGQIISKLKLTFSRLNDQKFYLLGDPTLTLLLPSFKTRIDKINNIAITDSSEIIHLKGMSKVQVEGSVLLPGTNRIDDSFNGTAYITMFDGDIMKVAYDIWENSDKFLYQRMGGALNRVMTKIENGKFSTSFVIPKDVSFSDSLGRLYAYGISDSDISGKKKYASGSTRKFIVDGVSTTDIQDTTPPEIAIFLDSRRFKSGDVVSNNPLLIVDLFDENGINMTGLGIGHLVEAWIDDNPNSINLTYDLKTSIEKANYSLIEKILYGIPAGNHILKLRAWDVFNNYSIDSIRFVTLPPGSNGRINFALCIPNPFDVDGTKIQFTHTLEPPIDAKLFIFNSIGEKVRDISTKLNNYNIGEIYWDARDNNGRIVPMGTYYIRIELTNSKGIKSESFNLIGVHIQ